MANFLDNIKGSFGKMQEESQLKKQISVIDDEIRKLKYAMGNGLYNRMKDGTETDFDALYEAITQKETALISLQDQYLLLKGMKRCPHCGEQMDARAVFCMICGTKFEDAELPEAIGAVKPAITIEAPAEAAAEVLAEEEEAEEDAAEEISDEKEEEEEKKEEEEAEEETVIYVSIPAARRCPNCGTAVPAGSTLCPQCGTKIEA